MYQRNIEAGSRNQRYRGKATIITHSQCASVAALVIQNAMRMLRVILSSEASPAVLYLSTVFRKWHDFFCSNFFENKMCFYFLYKFCLKHFSV